ncbi:MAG: hypothetical protein K8J08_12655, partial [Thermoanaerobaculia bacterium]|nr:hypothetical protein [Thermoanaerobaculia bacterium]
MRHLLLAGSLMLLAVSGARGDVALTIVNMPSDVLNFDPAYVLYAVENRGTAPVYLPGGQGTPMWGFSIYIASTGEELRPIPGPKRLSITPFPTRSMWLSPGERWMFYQDIGPALAALKGEIRVQAVLSSMGRCGDEQLYGRSAFPLEPLRIDTFQRSPTGRSWAVYRCWEGEVRSEARTLTVHESTDPIDREARVFVKEESQRPKANDESIRGSKTSPRGLDVLFPRSRYTFGYLTRAGSNIHARMLALELQPDHPLAPWVRGAIAKRALDFQSSCWDRKKWPFDRLGKQPPSFDASLLPAGLPEFLEQYRWYLEHRYCPRAIEGGGDPFFPRTWGEASVRPPQQLRGEPDATPTDLEGNSCERDKV